MSYIRAWALGVLVLVVAGCGAGRQAKTHAVALEAAHGLVDTAGHAIDDGCAAAVTRAPTLTRAEEIGERCRTAATTQRALVAAWTNWARAALVKLAGESFDLAVALTLGREVVRLYLEVAALVNAIVEGEPLPPPPAALVTLVGGDR